MFVLSLLTTLLPVLPHFSHISLIPMTNTYVLVHPEMYTYQPEHPNMWWDVQWNLSLPESADEAVTLFPWLCGFSSNSDICSLQALALVFRPYKAFVKIARHPWNEPNSGLHLK